MARNRLGTQDRGTIPEAAPAVGLGAASGAALRGALKHGEFSVHYQPRIDVDTGAPVGAEALLRWHHPDMGMISPARFIPIAEETGLIESIGEWVLRAACAQNRL